MSIFKAYDVRGTYPDQLDEDLAYRLGKAFVNVIKAKTIAVGYDMRDSSEKLRDALIKGLTDQGADVVLLGMVSTPMMYFAVGKYGYDAGIMITASHNPAGYNGFKMVRANAVPIGGPTGIMDIKEEVMKQSSQVMTKGNVEEKEIYEDYLHNALESTDSNLRKFKIVIDTANAMGGPVASRFFDHLDVDLVHMYPELDGTFPNHEANPLKTETLKDLQEKVREVGADFGIAFDGDADRMAFVDEEGKIIPSDLLGALISIVLLKEEEGAKIMYDVRSSKVVGEVIEENGGEAVRCKVGHSLIKSQMRDEGGFFGIELSGHYYYKPNYYIESPFILILKLMELMTMEDKKLSELISPLEKYFASGEINSKVEDKKGKMQELADNYSDGDVSWLDGVTVEYDTWWFNVRPSNTEPYLRLNLEADTQELMEEKRDEVLDIIRS